MASDSASAAPARCRRASTAAKSRPSRSRRCRSRGTRASPPAQRRGPSNACGWSCVRLAARKAQGRSARVACRSSAAAAPSSSAASPARPRAAPRLARPRALLGRHRAAPGRAIEPALHPTTSGLLDRLKFAPQRRRCGRPRRRRWTLTRWSRRVDGRSGDGERGHARRWRGSPCPRPRSGEGEQCAKRPQRGAVDVPEGAAEQGGKAARGAGAAGHGERNQGRRSRRRTARAGSQGDERRGQAHRHGRYDRNVLNGEGGLAMKKKLMRKDDKTMVYFKGRRAPGALVMLEDKLQLPTRRTASRWWRPSTRAGRTIGLPSTRSKDQGLRHRQKGGVPGRHQQNVRRVCGRGLLRLRGASRGLDEEL